MWAVQMVTMAVWTVLGQNHFLRPFRAVHSDGLADEALGIFGVRTELRTGLQTSISGNNQFCNIHLSSGRL
jgi:hypothetical protein